MVVKEVIQNIERFNCEELSREEIKEVLDFVISKIDENLHDFTYDFPGEASVNNKYEKKANDIWTTSFWTGMLWLAYEVTGDDKYRIPAEIQLMSFKDRLEHKVEIDTHDLGFLYSLSAVAQYKLTGNEVAKEVGIKAADYLIGRYKEKGEFIQAWGDINDPANYRLIIDCLLNLPLLYWATEVTGDEKYCNIAYKHYKTAVKYVIREDASTYHTFFFDPETGAPARGETHQGYSDDSSWARGEAWGIYGIPLNYRYTKDPEAEDLYRKLSNYFLNRLPEDLVAYWDLIFTDGNEPRDSSSNAIAVCGMLEMDKWMKDDEEKLIYKKSVHAMMRSLIDNYTTKNVDSNGILLHGVYGKPQNEGVDECVIWGDYYFMEALVRMYKDWELYW